jgi:hypothetical protein
MRVFLGLGALSLVAGGCLLVTSLDGLEGPPLGGAGGGAAGASVDASMSDGAQQNDAPIDGESDAADGARGGPVVFRDRTKGGTLRGLTVDKDGVYWAETSPATGILYAPKVGSSTPVHLEVATDLLGDVFDIGVDGVSLYWTDYKAATVRRRPLTGGNVADDYFTGANHAAYLAMADNGHVLLTDNNLNIAVVVYGPPSLAVANTQGPPATGIAYASSVVYWAYGNPSAIATSDVTGMSLNNNFYVPTGGVTITGIACDESNLYWIENGESIQWIDLVQKVPNAPLYTAAKKFEDANNVGDIAVDADWIYFTAPLDRVIYRLAKPPTRDR